MTGKKTPDDQMSGSILARFSPDFPYGQTINDALDRCIRARKGENVRNDFQSSIMRMGDVLENPVLVECCTRLNLSNARLDIETPLTHPTLRMNGSPDGIATAGVDKPIVVGTDAEKGIYTLNDTYLYLEGDGILECKVTRDWADDVLPNWRGKWQAMAYAEMLGLSWCAVVVLYQSTDLRIFVFERDPEWVKWFEKTVIDFERRIVEEDYYNPANSVDCNTIWPTIEYDELIELDDELILFFEEIKAAKDVIKEKKQTIDDCETVIKSHMKENKNATCGNFRATWGSRTYKAKPERIVPAKESYTIRSKVVTIKEFDNESV